MKRLLTLTLASMLALTAAPAVIAQSSNANERAGQNREARESRDNRGNGNQNRENRGQQSRESGERTNNGLGRDGWNYGRVISSLRNGTADDIYDVLGDAESVGMLSLSALGQPARNASALGNALEATGQTEEEVQAAIAANTNLSDAIGAAGYAAEDIIGFTYDRNGNIILIVDDLD